MNKATFSNHVTEEETLAFALGDGIEASFSVSASERAFWKRLAAIVNAHDVLVSALRRVGLGADLLSETEIRSAARDALRTAGEEL